MKQTVLLIFEIIILIIGFIMIIVGLLQPKKSQAGLGALTGGNQDLFAQSKERGLERTLSLAMLIFGTFFVILAIVLRILENVL